MILNSDELDGVHVGMTVHEAENVLNTKFVVEVDDENSPESCGFAYRQDGRDGDIAYMVEGGRITRIDVMGNSADKGVVRTATGIGIGSTETQIRKAYGAQIRVERNLYDENGRDYLVPGPLGTAFLFEAVKGKVVRFRSGKVGPVSYPEGCY